MGSQNTLVRTLKIARDIKTEIGCTVSQLANRYQVSVNTIYTTLESLEEVGYEIKKEGNRRIGVKFSKESEVLGELLHFSDDEFALLDGVAAKLGATTEKRRLLVQKLHSLFSFDRFVFGFKPKEQSENILNLSKAIQQEKQVILSNYKSSNSGTTEDRLVEPFRLTENLDFVWAYDPVSKSCKTFRTSRTKKVNILEHSWQFKNYHETIFTDFFNMTSSTPKKVSFKMTLRAFNLLIEEYPSSQEFCKALEDGNFYFSAKVAGFEGIGRFILGVLDEVVDIETKQLKSFLIKKIERFLN